jgi:AraC-like DNA-binding protein
MTDSIGNDGALARLSLARDRLREPERVALERIAREARLSTGELIRRFAALFGETPHRYRARERLDRAKRLLAGTRRSVTEVCLDVGFSSVGSFSAWFARCAGLAPSAYRRSAAHRAARPSSDAESFDAGCFALLTAALAHPAYRERNFEEAPQCGLQAKSGTHSATDTA